ncbi:MAG TPA: hypothetical protein VM537_31470 [Anaerolineae bacterium]|nr:hypothetical protein [Anaerolineae bacterium]
MERLKKVVIWAGGSIVVLAFLFFTVPGRLVLNVLCGLFLLLDYLLEMQ